MPGSTSSRLAGALAVIALLCVSATAQTIPVPESEKPFRYNGSGYVVLGMGACKHRVTNTSLAGGGDAFLWQGLTLGGDIGYYRFVERNSNPFGIASLNIGYSFVNRDTPGRIEPFLRAGFPGAAFAHGGGTAAFSLGGGLNYWFRKRMAIRAEFRATGVDEEALAMFRIGLAFR